MPIKNSPSRYSGEHIKKFFLLPDKTNRIILMVFIILSLALLFNHDPWRDEAQAWLIARDSPNISSMIQSIDYEGTPALWHIILFPLVHSGLPYFTMSVAHFLIILTAVIIFINYAPFSRYQKTLFIFGYFILYEYNTIARSYALSVLFLFLIASVYKERFKKPILYSLLILLLANTNVHSLTIAIVLSGVYLFELRAQENSNKSKFAISSLIIFGFLIAMYQLLPPADLDPTYVKWNLDLSVQHIGVIPHAITGAFLPILHLGSRISFLEGILIYIPTQYTTVFGFPLFLLSLGFFLESPKSMLIYLLSSFGLFSIFFLKYSGGLNHYGLIFILFIFSLWIAKEEEKKLLIKNEFINRVFSQKNLIYLLGILLFFQVISSSVAVYYGLNYDLSAGKKTATYLKENRFINNDTFIATYPSSPATSILPYIQEPYSRFFYTEYNDYHSFMIWNKKYVGSSKLPLNEVLDRIDVAISNKNYSKVLFITNKAEDGERISEKYSLIAYFNKTIADSESFYIYQLKLH